MVVVAPNGISETEPPLYSPDYEPTENNLRNRTLNLEAYENILCVMKIDSLNINSPEVACEILLTAVKLRNRPLTQKCIEFLDIRLNKDNVLSILTDVGRCRTEQPHQQPPPYSINDYYPTAPPLSEIERNDDDRWYNDRMEDLRYNCFVLIDKNGDYVLKKAEIVDVDYRDLLAITTRDSLQVSSELIVYSAVVRWGEEECRRRGAIGAPQSDTMKTTLGDLRFAPRYGLMTKKEFSVSGCQDLLATNSTTMVVPALSGILDENECAKVLRFIKEKRRNNCEPLPFCMSKTRQCSLNALKPKILSSRSAFEAKELSNTQNSRQCPTTPPCEKVFVNFLSCWSAIFD